MAEIAQINARSYLATHDVPDFTDVLPVEKAKGTKIIRKQTISIDEDLAIVEEQVAQERERITDALYDFAERKKRPKLQTYTAVSLATILVTSMAAGILPDKKFKHLLPLFHPSGEDKRIAEVLSADSTQEAVAQVYTATALAHAATPIEPHSFQTTPVAENAPATEQVFVAIAEASPPPADVTASPVPLHTEEPTTEPTDESTQAPTEEPTIEPTEELKTVQIVESTPEAPPATLPIIELTEEPTTEPAIESVQAVVQTPDEQSTEPFTTSATIPDVQNEPPAPAADLSQSEADDNSELPAEQFVSSTTVAEVQNVAPTTPQDQPLSQTSDESVSPEQPDTTHITGDSETISDQPAVTDHVQNIPEDIEVVPATVNTEPQIAPVTPAEAGQHLEELEADQIAPHAEIVPQSPDQHPPEQVTHVQPAGKATDTLASYVSIDTQQRYQATDVTVSSTDTRNGDLSNYENIETAGTFDTDWPQLEPQILQNFDQQINSLYAQITDQSSLPEHIVVVHYERSTGVLFTRDGDHYNVTKQFPVGLASPANRDNSGYYTDFSYNTVNWISPDTYSNYTYGKGLITLDLINGESQPEEIHDGTSHDTPDSTVQSLNTSNGCVTTDFESIRFLQHTLTPGDHVIVIPNDQTNISEFFSIDTTEPLASAANPWVSSASYYSTHEFPRSPGSIITEQRNAYTYYHPEISAIEQSGAVEVNYSPILNDPKGGAVVTVNIFDGTATVYQLDGNGHATPIYSAYALVGERLPINPSMSQAFDATTFTGEIIPYFDGSNGVYTDSYGYRHTLTPQLIARYQGHEPRANFGDLPVITEAASIYPLLPGGISSSNIPSEYTIHKVPPMSTQHYQDRLSEIQQANIDQHPAEDPYWSHGCVNLAPDQWEAITTILDASIKQGGNAYVIFSYPNTDQTSIVRPSYEAHDDPLYDTPGFFVSVSPERIDVPPGNQTILSATEPTTPSTPIQGENLVTDTNPSIITTTDELALHQTQTKSEALPDSSVLTSTETIPSFMYKIPGNNNEMMLQHRFWMLLQIVNQIPESIPLTASVDGLELGQIRVVMNELKPEFENGTLSFKNFPLGLPWEGVSLPAGDPSSQNTALEQWAMQTTNTCFSGQSHILGPGVHDVAVLLASPSSYDQLLTYLSTANGSSPSNTFDSTAYEAGYIIRDSSEIMTSVVTDLSTQRDQIAQQMGFMDYEDFDQNRPNISAVEAIQNPYMLRFATINGIETLLTSPDFNTFVQSCDISSYSDMTTCVMVYVTINEFGSGALDDVLIMTDENGNPMFVASDNTPNGQSNRALAEFKFSQLVYMRHHAIEMIRNQYGNDPTYVDTQGNLTQHGELTALIVFGEYYEPIRDLDSNLAGQRIYQMLRSHTNGATQAYIMNASEWLSQFNDEERLNEYYNWMREHPSMHAWDFAVVSEASIPGYLSTIHVAVQNPSTNLPNDIYWIDQVGENAYGVYGDVGWSRGGPHTPSATRNYGNTLPSLLQFYKQRDTELTDNIDTQAALSNQASNNQQRASELESPTDQLT